MSRIIHRTGGRSAPFEEEICFSSWNKRERSKLFILALIHRSLVFGEFDPIVGRLLQQNYFDQDFHVGGEDGHSRILEMRFRA